MSMVDKLTPPEYATCLRDTWFKSQDPTGQLGVATICTLFERADKQLLMTSEELAYLKSLPNTLYVFRGISVGFGLVEGVCWTLDIDVARRFACTNDDQKGIILQGKIAKEDIYMFTQARNESEIVINPSRISELTPVEVVQEEDLEQEDDGFISFSTKTHSSHTIKDIEPEWQKVLLSLRNKGLKD